MTHYTWKDGQKQYIEPVLEQHSSEVNDAQERMEQRLSERKRKAKIRPIHPTYFDR